MVIVGRGGDQIEVLDGAIVLALVMQQVGAVAPPVDVVGFEREGLAQIRDRVVSALVAACFVGTLRVGHRALRPGKPLVADDAVAGLEAFGLLGLVFGEAPIVAVLGVVCEGSD